MSELSVPVYARLGGNECQIGVLLIEEGTETCVSVEPEKLRLARDVFVGLQDGES